jgi:hypothetical protein
MIINGSGGSGKSVVINTIVTVMRKMFNINGVVKVAAPTGTAAFNVHGETLHHLFGMGISGEEYKPNAMNPTHRARLIQKFKTVLALIIDERSLMTSRNLGTAEQMLSETIYDGGPFPQKSWGGIPIVIMVGDDYQLAGIGDGPLTALYIRNRSKISAKGRDALLECSEFVMNLSTSKRINNSQQGDKDLIDRIRLAEKILPSDVEKLLSLTLDNIKRRHGVDTVQEIKDKSIFLFYRNARRIRHNLEQIVVHSSNVNPVAIIKCSSTGKINGKAIGRHFDGSNDSEGNCPKSCLVNVGAKVAINNRNFCPIWGLHNGACGIVDEVVFAKGTNPNNGDQPLFIVVIFPLYCGPIWDRNNTKVNATNM